MSKIMKEDSLPLTVYELHSFILAEHVKYVRSGDEKSRNAMIRISINIEEALDHYRNEKKA
jgi:hypothetical protein